MVLFLHRLFSDVILRRHPQEAEAVFVHLSHLLNTTSASHLTVLVTPRLQLMSVVQFKVLFHHLRELPLPSQRHPHCPHLLRRSQTASIQRSPMAFSAFSSLGLSIHQIRVPPVRLIYVGLLLTLCVLHTPRSIFSHQPVFRHPLSVV